MCLLDKPEGPGLIVEPGRGVAVVVGVLHSVQVLSGGLAHPLQSEGKRGIRDAVNYCWPHSFLIRSVF